MTTTSSDYTSLQLMEIIDTNKPWHQLTLDILCIVTPVLLFLAPISLFGPVIHARCKYGKQSSRSHIVMPPLHFSAMYMQCYAFTVFSLGIKEPVIYLHTIPGIVLSALWMALYAVFYAEEEAHKEIKAKSLSMKLLTDAVADQKAKEEQRKLALRRYNFLRCLFS